MALLSLSMPGAIPQQIIFQLCTSLLQGSSLIIEMVILIRRSCRYPFAMASMQEGSLGFSGTVACFMSYGDSLFQSLFKSIAEAKSR